MDTLTHAVTGALLVRVVAPAGSGDSRPGMNSRMLAGGMAAVFPDVDFGLRLVDTLTYLNWHQGPTHSLVLLPIWALPLAWLCTGIGEHRYRWQTFYIPVCLGLAIHIAGDALTAYGPMLLSPFSNQRYFVPWLYLLDPVFSTIAIIGLATVLLLPGGRYAASATLVLLAAYSIWQSRLHEEAINAGRDYVRSRTIEQAEVHALPQPLSPFNWKVIVDHGGIYHEALINLRDGSTEVSPRAGMIQRLNAAYKSPVNASWQPHERAGAGEETVPVQEAWQHPALAPFRRFAMYPVFDRIEETGDGVCVWFFDLRFNLPVIPPSYRFGACRNGDDWQLKRQRGAFWID